MGESERYIDRRFKKITLGEDNNALVALISINGIGFVSLRSPTIRSTFYLIRRVSAAAFCK